MNDIHYVIFRYEFKKEEKKVVNLSLIIRILTSCTSATSNIMPAISIIVSILVAIYASINNLIVQNKHFDYLKRTDDFEKVNKIIIHEFAPLVLKIVENRFDVANEYTKFREIIAELKNSISYLYSEFPELYTKIKDFLVDIDHNIVILYDKRNSNINSNNNEDIKKIKKEIENLFCNFRKTISNFLKKGKNKN